MKEKTPVPDALTGWAQQHGFDCSDIDSRSDNAMTPLMLAAMQGKLETVQVLLAAGANCNFINADENNALWFACVSNDSVILDELLHYGCNIDNQNVNGATCLVYAASAGKFDIVKQLVQAGADIDRQTLDGFDALESASTLPVLRFLKSSHINKHANKHAQKNNDQHNDQHPNA
jgi:ankyrin repeat protein